MIHLFFYFDVIPLRLSIDVDSKQEIPFTTIVITRCEPFFSSCFSLPLRPV